MTTFGPGTLKIGPIGTELDVSCLVNSLTITTSKDQGDATTKLCGTVRPGKITYTYALAGNLDIDDTAGQAGLFALSQTAPGSEQPFEFVPNTATSATATGTLILDPLNFGADEYGADLTSDIEFALVGAPVYTYPAPVGEAFDPFARRVQNGAEAPTVVA